MDIQGLLPPPAKPLRRKNLLEFKAQFVAASYTDNTSVASVAQRFNINANLVHKWRRQCFQYKVVHLHTPCSIKNGRRLCFSF